MAASLGVNLRPEDKQSSLEVERDCGDSRAGGQAASRVVSPDHPVAADKVQQMM
jgi:hypothetical protein